MPIPYGRSSLWISCCLQPISTHFSFELMHPYNTLLYPVFSLLWAVKVLKSYILALTNPFTDWTICIAVGNPIPVPSCLVCCYQPIYTIWWNLGYPGHCYQPIYNMGYLHCCWQPNACARLFSVLLPTHLHYLVKSRLSRALLLTTHLKYGLFAPLLAIQT